MPDGADPWTASLSLAQLYFAEASPADRTILRHGPAGPAVDRGHVSLRASDTDCSLFNDVPEVATCGAVVPGERLRWPPGAALGRSADGHLAVCSIDYHIATPAAEAMWRQPLTNMGVKLGVGRRSAAAAFDDAGAVAAARVTGRFPAVGPLPADAQWAVARPVDRDRFRVDPGGPADHVAVYVRFWVDSPRASDDLLAVGPDVPRFDLTSDAADSAELELNGRPVTPARAEPADSRTRADSDGRFMAAVESTATDPGH